MFWLGFTAGLAIATLVVAAAVGAALRYFWNKF